MRVGAWVRLVFVLSMLAPLVVSSTSPLPPEYYEFHISGRITHRGGAPAADQSVGVAAFVSYYNEPGEWMFLQNDCSMCGCGPGSFLALSDAQGGFSVDVRCRLLHDSLSVAVVYPDTMLFGTPFAAEGGSLWEDETWYLGTEDGFVCDDTKAYRVVEGYVYTHRNKDTTVP